MFKKQTEKGFTLIELLVVIAIIGILATIVLTSLGSARKKASDSKYQGQISSLRAAAEAYYGSQNPPSYSGLCTVASTDTTGAYNLLQNANYSGSTGYITCFDSATAWVAAVPSATAPTTLYFCADSNGVAKTRASLPTSAATGC